MRVPDRSLRSHLERHHGALRRGVIARHAVRAFAGSAVVLAVLVTAGAFLPMGPAAATFRLVLLGLAVLVTLGWAARATARRSPRFARYLEQVEERFPEVRSWLRNALELERAETPDTSPELASALRAETTRRMERVPLPALAVPVRPARPLGAALLALVLILVAGLLSPAAVRRSWATLFDPSAAAPPVRLAVEPGSVRITPGASLSVRARVWGTASAPRLLRDQPTTPAPVDEGVDASGARRWRFDLAQLTRAEDYRVRVAAVHSPRYRISLDGTPAALAFEVELRSPAYARLPVQRGSSTRGDLSALRGSVARVNVTFDRDLDALEATLPGGKRATFRAQSPRRWSGEVPVLEDGTWTLHAHAAAGDGRFRYPMQALADAPPLLAVRVPEGDIDLPAGQQVPVAVVGQDDLGLTELTLEFRKDAAAPWRTAPLAAFDARPREAEVATRWDASMLGLMPGETASFRFVLYDDNAIGGRGRAVSPAFELRFPSLADLYDRTDDAQRGVQSTLEQAAERVKELQKSLEKLERQQAARTAPQNAPAFERSEEMRNALERQQELSKQLDEASKTLRESVEQAAERKAFDQELLRKMREMADLLQQIQSPELRKAMEKMQQALQNLDKRALEQNLAQMREQNQELLENLQRSIELLKRLREEEKLASLAQRAEELKRQQDQLNQEHDQAGERKPSDAPRESQERAQRAGQQQQAAEQSEKLADDVKEMAKTMDEESERESLEKAAEEIGENAASEQQDAAQSARQNQSQKASRSGKSASQSLQKGAQQMQQMAGQRRQEREGADLAAVRRAAQDLVALERANSTNLTSSAPPGQKADRQTDLAEGVARVADSLGTLARRTPFLSQKVSESLGKALQGLQGSGRDLAAGNRQRGEQSGRSAGQSLNEVVLELRNTESSMCSSPSASAGGQNKPSPGQRMGELGEQQGQLNQQTRSVARRLSQQMQETMGNPQELQRLAAEQARIRQQLEQLQRDDETENKLLGRLDQAAREMKEVEEALRSGGTSPGLEEKQQRILSRMLDAQRSVHRRDFEPQRESRPGEDLARRSPSELPSDLLRESDRLRLGLLKAEADRYPAQYRAYIESYLRALNEKRR